MEFTAADLAASKLYYKGLSAGTDALTIQAYDGQDWSAAYAFNMTVRLTDTPLTIAATNTAPSGSTLLSTMVSFTNPSHDAVRQLQIYTDSVNNDGGYISYIDGAGVTQNVLSGTNINLTSDAEVASVRYVPGSSMVGASETLHINAFDGYSWSGWSALIEQANSGSQMMLGLSSDGLSGILENSTGGTIAQVTSNVMPTLSNYLESSGQQIHLDIRTLTGLSGDANGNLLASQFVSGASAQNSLGGSTHVAYDTNTGGLYYQAAGHAAVEIAIIGQAGHITPLHAVDFHLG
jgi:hypothetical protein